MLHLFPHIVRLDKIGPGLSKIKNVWLSVVEFSGISQSAF